jgi:rhomboid protease GluP
VNRKSRPITIHGSPFTAGIRFCAKLSHNAFSIPAVLDLNHIFLFIACVSPLVLLAQAWKRGGMNRAWRIAACAVLLVTGASWILLPAAAGFVGGGAWLVLILVPSLGLRKAAELTAQQRYAPAWRLARVLRFLHPADGLLEQSDLLRALEVAQRGDFASALALLGPLRSGHTNVGHQAIAQSFRIRGDWNGLLGWLRGELSPGVVQTDLALLPLYLRALGETGARDELLLEFTTNAKGMSRVPQHVWLYDVSLLPVLAFNGRIQALSKLLETKLRKLPRDTNEFWMGIGQLAAGETMAGRARLEKLRATAGDALIRADAARCLERANEIVHAPLSALSPATALLRRIEQSDRPSTRVFASETRPTTVVLILIALNLAMFVAEYALGGSTNPFTLHRLGALEYFSVRYQHEYWRLLTSLFLHYGPLHLLFNLYALFIIGPGLERAIGSIRFGICYLFAGLGSGLGVLFLRLLGLNSSELLVGASGCVMGLVGVWAGLLLRHRHAPMAGRRLKNILVIVAIQTAFDLSTPQISMAAHLSGLVTGLMLGLIFAPRRSDAW